MLARRRFLFAAGSLAAAGAFGLQKLLQPGQLKQVRRSSFALGTKVSITALHAEESVAAAAIESAFAELETVESVMSIYRKDSQISRLNSSGALDAPHPYLMTVLEFSQRVSDESNGAFDVTVQPLWQIFSEAKKRGILPTAAEIAEAKSKVGNRNLTCSADSIRLASGAQITLNGIAQGFALDRAIAALRSFGIQNAMLDTGEQDGLGRKEHGESWKAGIQHPRVADSLCAVLKLDGRCLATSGDYETYFSNDFVNNHIFDPHTGRSPSEFSSVSVLAECGMEADALSTAAFVLGAERSLKLLEAHRADAHFVRKNGDTLATAGFKKLLCEA